MDLGSIGTIISIIVMIGGLIVTLWKMFTGFIDRIDVVRKDFNIGLVETKVEFASSISGAKAEFVTESVKNYAALDTKYNILDVKLNGLDKKVAVIGADVGNVKDSMKILLGNSTLLLQKNGIDPPEEGNSG